MSQPTDTIPALPVHGGDLAWASAHFGTPEDGWLDLSTGINPVPYPMQALPGDVWHRLPQVADMRALIEAAAACYRVADTNSIVAANGSQAILQMLPRLISAGRVAILTPSYGEYAPCWRAAGHEVVLVKDIAAAAMAAPVVVLANPNNPDGRRVLPADLIAVADALAARGGLLIVDEAFADASPEISVAPHTGREGLLVLRSFGKFFGLAGLRLGFALASPAIADRLRAALGPWPVNGPAIAIGAQGLTDRNWAAWTRERLQRDSARLAHLLKDSSLGILGRTANFCLASHEHAADLFDYLARNGILARAFTEQPTWLRFGLPPADAFTRLEGALGDWHATRRS
jgi:cobalamin biosynthetic protein CobC